ncbi:Macrophage erythroblast attacher [Vanrija pseudolonga]|uniref:Macrophage erythroblast attacher n=1 Tax=Vanrija pseudolonga TaxID=143232 RepID=A0AAF1BLY4_9TREE|nr:Macrophage erythroblast attacher [Vanrija pseudolonga]
MPQPQTGIHGPLLLEEPLIRTPYELLRRSHRSAQRQVEKDFIAVQTQLSSLLKSFSGSDGDAATAQTKLDAASERVRGLKRKLDDLQPSAAAPSVLRDRLKHVDEALLAPKGAKVAEDKTLDRYIADHLLRTGRMKTARTLAESAGIESLVDLKLFAELTKIEKALLEKNSCAEALAWCGENRGTLKKQGSNLEFALRLQEFIELCRKRDTAGARAYAAKNLAQWAATPEMQQGATLLAFGETTGVPRYRKLYDRARWQQVQVQFRETFLGIYALPSQSLLALSLSAGLSSLRLPACVTTEVPGRAAAQAAPQPAAPLIPTAPNLLVLGLDGLAPADAAPAVAPVPTPTGDESAPPEPYAGNVDCPTCAEHMRVLAREVPLAHHVNSTLVCRITGDVMDSENEPMAFPNGNVYSSKALIQMAKEHHDVVTCPRTHEACAFTHLRKVYIS